jgi:hypothetical protein
MCHAHWETLPTRSASGLSRLQLTGEVGDVVATGAAAVSSDLPTASSLTNTCVMTHAAFQVLESTLS